LLILRRTTIFRQLLVFLNIGWLITTIVIDTVVVLMMARMVVMVLMSSSYCGSPFLCQFNLIFIVLFGLQFFCFDFFFAIWVKKSVCV
jgi:hypothetical protein